MYILLLAANSYAKRIASTQFKLKREGEGGEDFCQDPCVRLKVPSAGAINDADEYDKAHQNVLARNER